MTTRYRVHLHSKPAVGLTFYEGYVDVLADSADQAPDAAMAKLRRTAFPDRTPNDWRVVAVDVLAPW